MRKVVFVTQQVDPAHPALAATVPKIGALAALVDEVIVLADGAVPGVLPANARVRTFRARRKAGRGLRFETALARELRGLRGGAVVAHMCPIYAVLAAPLVRPLRIPLVLWFTHWRASRLLQAAERASTAVTSVDPRSFALPSRKLRAIGHGIDLAEFPCARPREGDGTRLLALGRYSTAKGLDVVLAAVNLAGPDVELQVHGPTLSEDERHHRAELKALTSELGLDGRVVIGDAVPRAELPGLFAEHDALVNNMREGAPDKVVYEAAAGCLPVLASNSIFGSLLDREQRFTRWDPNTLADAIRTLAATSQRSRVIRKTRICRNTRTLFNCEPSLPDEEIHGAAPRENAAAGKRRCPRRDRPGRVWQSGRRARRRKEETVRCDTPGVIGSHGFVLRCIRPCARRSSPAPSASWRRSPWHRTAPSCRGRARSPASSNRWASPSSPWSIRARA